MATGENSASSRAVQKMHCRTSITGTFATGQMAVRVDIIEREGDGSARLQIFSPVGMYLQKPVKLTVDQGAAPSRALYLVPHQRLHRGRPWPTPR